MISELEFTELTTEPITEPLVETRHVSRRSDPLPPEVPYGRDAYLPTVPLQDRLLSFEEIDRIVDNAKEGNQEAKDKLTMLMMHRAWGRGIHLALYYHALKDVYIDAQDIIQTGVLTAIERMDKALAHPNPFGYLCKASEGAMLNFCREGQSMVRVPMTSQRRGHRAPYVDSLDTKVSAHVGLTLLEIIPSRDLQVAEDGEEYFTWARHMRFVMMDII